MKKIGLLLAAFAIAGSSFAYEGKCCKGKKEKCSKEKKEACAKGKGCCQKKSEEKKTTSSTTTTAPTK